MATARSAHVQTTLANGAVLVTGGTDGFLQLFATAEVFNPTSNAWRSAGSMSSVRYQHTATLLANGMVLAAGGSNQPDQPSECSCTTYIASADVYDPTTNGWTPIGPLLTARYNHTATLLGNGKVLVTGGFGGVTSTLQNIGTVLASAEIYDPTAGNWSAAASMNSARMNHSATLLPSGKVLVTGGTDGTSTLATAEVYDPTSDIWTPVASLSTPRQFHVAQILSSGTVLVVGGLNDTSSAVFGVSSSEVYDPVANSWSAAGSMNTARQHFILSALGDGRLILDGGTPNTPGLPEFYH
jgi:N-acetylneuraminic acid mutarotase